jgi:hypothetical protein
MVASDTVVGLVGAGILLVALVGVFVYESQQGTGSEELKNAVYPTKTDGSVAYVAGTGTQVAMGRCVATPPQTQCTPAKATVDVKFTGLPSPGNLHYVVYLEGGGQDQLIGEATASGASYATGAKSVDGDHSAQKTLVVSLESVASAAAPTMKILSKDVGSGAVSGSVDVMFIKTTGNHTLSFSGSSVDATLRGLPMKDAFTYRGWLVKENSTGLAYVFVGNFTADAAAANSSAGATQSGHIKGTIKGVKSDYTRFIVTYESKTAPIGMKPAGPPVIKADYNLRMSPTVAK